MDAYEIIPGVYQLTPFRYVNLLVIAREKLALIDTGVMFSAGIVLDFIESLGRKPAEIDLIIITHNHFDHVGGFAELRRFTQAKVALHQSDLDVNHPPYPGILAPHLLKTPIFSWCLSSLYLKRGEIDIVLAGGEVFDLLGGLEVIHTPGHTPGSISLFSRKERLLIVGDALAKHWGRIDPPVKRNCYDFPLAMNSVKHLSQLDFKTICFGHGRPVNGDAGVRVRALVGEI